MKTKIKNKGKRIYCSPKIEVIKLDSVISLVLESSVEPDSEPNWSKTANYLNNKPFKFT